VRPPLHFLSLFPSTPLFPSVSSRRLAFPVTAGRRRHRTCRGLSRPHGPGTRPRPDTGRGGSPAAARRCTVADLLRGSCRLLLDFVEPTTLNRVEEFEKDRKS